jgi:hypothetical protein
MCRGVQCVGPACAIVFAVFSPACGSGSAPTPSSTNDLIVQVQPFTSSNCGDYQSQSSGLGTRLAAGSGSVERT